MLRLLKEKAELGWLTENLPLNIRNVHKTKITKGRVVKASGALKIHYKRAKYLLELARFSAAVEGGDMVLGIVEKDVKQRITEDNLLDWDVDYLFAKKKKNCYFFLEGRLVNRGRYRC